MWLWIFLTVIVLDAFIVIHDPIQKKHAILKYFSLVGHFRYWLEAVGPELRQYIVTSNNEEHPFSRNHCPTGIATQNCWLVRGLDPTLKSQRVANYIFTLPKELQALCRAAGVPQPALISADRIEILDGRYEAQSVSQLFHDKDGCSLPSAKDQVEICEFMSSGKFDYS